MKKRTARILLILPMVFMSMFPYVAFSAKAKGKGKGRGKKRTVYHNPFKRPDEYQSLVSGRYKKKKKKKKKKLAKKAAPVKFKISLLVKSDDGNDFFIVKDKVYRVGDSIGQNEVLEIMDSSVLISNGMVDAEVFVMPPLPPKKYSLVISDRGEK
jgi:hypothetical protein